MKTNRKTDRPQLQKQLADSRLGGPYARDTHRGGLGADYTRDEHSPRVRETKAGGRKLGKASE